ncbi:thiamine pyrophosphate-dependent enzyme, partial [Candidatus Liberibacter sp.]|uniref:thiamine pyrophosphate-dependent enzyme n=1 Tax=Candidatus Liberibacter sp. TaxID=34022 RepID=UPI0015F74BC2
MQKYSSERLSLSSFLDGSNYSYVESLYKNYKENPLSVGDEWRSLFLLLDKNPEHLDRLGENSQRFLKDKKIAGDVVSGEEKDDFISSNNDQSVKDFYRVMMMVEAYRTRGHFNARLDPLGLASPSVDLQDLSPSYYGFTEVDYERRIFMDGVLGLEYSIIPEIKEILSQLYCSTIGVEFMHLSSFEERDWIQNAIEKGGVLDDLSADQRKGILGKLIEAEGFENFIDVKYKGAKRFGIDGSEVIIPALEAIIKEGVQQGVVDVVMGMSHRGRLNVLSQVVGKPQRAILYEFRGADSNSTDVGHSGDVKYHLGASCTCQISGKDINISLMNNPSHLDFIDSVVMGGARARQDIIADIPGGEYSVPLQDRSKVLPILVHGDAAFAGQGIVSEVLGLSGLSGYTVAGNVHLIVNNQIGFTTNMSSGRSFPYPSDISKALSIPVFHVNGDDPDSVIRVVRIATLFRMKFQKSVVIDVLGYRRLGHNEGDEPSFTQPKMYKTIRSHQSVVQLYADRLIREKIVSAKEVQSLKDDWRLYLEGEFKASDNYRPEERNDSFCSTPLIVKRKEKKGLQKTSVPQDLLKEIGSKLCYIPKSFNLHKVVGRLIENRKKMIEEGMGVDWAMAEALAFGSLCIEGYKVR